MQERTSSDLALLTSLQMIDQALNLLTLHVIWKARRLSTEVQASPDDGRLKESFQEQREALLKRLVEYAVGSQSNTTDGVRRAVSAPFAALGRVI